MLVTNILVTNITRIGPVRSGVMTAEMMAGMRAPQSVLTPEDVAGWVVRLVEDDRRAGAILQLTKADGGTYVD